ncbi:MAG: FHA domain-containing protein [Clostridia bacterium]|nr:FHA domain-containing protein [Clostridia bacterium]
MAAHSATPYIGNEKYAVVLNCPEDFSVTEKLIARLELDGYRIWFDDENLPEAEKIGNIEKYIKNCNLCVAVLTGNAVNSHIFRSCLTFAVNAGVTIVSALEENAALTVGMQLQVNTTAVIEKYRLTGDEFYSRLTEVKKLRECRDARQKKVATMWLERMSSKDIVVLKNGAMTIGRLASICDYAIENNHYIGRIHATIINSGDRCAIVDNNSKNKTFVNERMLVPEEPFPLNDGDIVKIANEKFVFHQN